MPSPPFDRMFFEQPGFVPRMFGTLPNQNALAELNNLLAEAQDVTDVTRSEVDRIADKYSITFQQSFPTELAALYRKALTFYLADCELSEADTPRLRHLRDLFGIHPPDAQAIQQRASADAFRRAVRTTIASHHIDPGLDATFGELSSRLLMDGIESRRFAAGFVAARWVG